MAELRFALITCSDTRSIDEDSAGKALARMVEERGWSVASHLVVPDDRAVISAAIVEAVDVVQVDVVLTCGGTGFGPRDTTPEATLDVADRIAPGIAEAVRAASLAITGRAMLSRAVSAMRARALVVNLPGSEKGATESLAVFIDQIEHAVSMAHGGGH